MKRYLACYREEIFGPVLSVVRVDNLEEAMRLVDDHEYGVLGRPDV